MGVLLRIQSFSLLSLLSIIALFVIVDPSCPNLINKSSYCALCFFLHMAHNQTNTSINEAFLRA